LCGLEFTALTEAQRARLKECFDYFEKLPHFPADHAARG